MGKILQSKIRFWGILEGYRVLARASESENRLIASQFAIFFRESCTVVTMPDQKRCRFVLMYRHSPCRMVSHYLFFFGGGSQWPVLIG